MAQMENAYWQRTKVVGLFPQSYSITNATISRILNIEDRSHLPHMHAKIMACQQLFQLLSLTGFDVVAPALH